jgi:multiple sugar transport system substrate-binding protein
MDNDGMMPTQSLSRRRFLAGAAVAGLGAALAASGFTGKASAAVPVPKAELDAALNTPTQLNYWAWDSNINIPVGLFEKKYPNIKVNIVNNGGGPAQYTKLRTALKAGTGAPDIAQIEYLELPSFIITNSLMNLAPYGAASIADNFLDWVWGQVSHDGTIYAIPQDTGPMAMIYRKDIFEKYDLDVPTTYAELASVGKKLHAAAPGVSITNLSSNDINFVVALIWQAGGFPFSAVENNTISINLADAPARKVAEYLTPLIQSGVISTDPDFTPSWINGLTVGKYASWLTAAWGAIVLTADAAKSSGNWRAAPLPQWSAGAHVSANCGGSSAAVITGTKNAAAAAELAKFISTDQAAIEAQSSAPQLLFPSTKARLASGAFLDSSLAFFGNQQVNRVFAAAANEVNTQFVWPPIYDEVTTAFNNTVGVAMANKTDLVASLEAWQSTVVKYAQSQGLKVRA